MSYENVPGWIRQIPEHLKMQEMCEEEVRIVPKNISQYILRCKRCEMRQCVGNHLHYITCQGTLRLMRCETKECA